MDGISMDYGIYLEKIIEKCGLSGIYESIADSVLNKKTIGSEFMGWMDYEASPALMEEIYEHSSFLRDRFDEVVVIGIGGSYLGAKAAVDFLSAETAPGIHFCGYNLSPDTYNRLSKKLKGRRTAIIVISKSGRTLEPALSLRIILKMTGIDFSRAEKAQITAITDGNSGLLREAADQNKWKTFAVPNDIGGRFSVMTPVGLLPLAAAGADVKKLSKCFCDARETYRTKDIRKNSALRYSFIRFNLYLMGYLNELLITWQERTHFIGLWWQQLFGECEGKDLKGIFPSTAHCTRDLHSVGQYLQDGRKELFETFFWVKNDLDICIPETNLGDKLEYLAGKNLSWINEQAKKGTRKAHENSGRPVIDISVDKTDESRLGELFAFFMFSAAFSSQFIGVNAYNQPGVEAYKKEMMELLKYAK
ncbi:glucose-6-phosphate isomerase [candidate division WOR-3 bacterium]|nr:glucose-6-phosphate isomerase [candidate division WOR-3 bacterium]